MSNVRSFKEYVSNRFYNSFCSAAKAVIRRNWDSFNVNCYKLNRPGEPEIDDIRVEHIWANDEPGMKIQFDAAVSVSLVIRDLDYHNDNEEYKTVWIMARCRGDLDKNFDDFDIFDCYPYDGKNRQENPMDDSLVPYMSSDSMEKEAERILRQYYPEALDIRYNSPKVRVDPMRLAGRLRLNVIQTGIRNDSTVFGRIYFENTEADIFDRDELKAAKLPVQAGTILVDPDVFFMRNLGALNNTIVHECVHWIEHRKAFALARLYDSDITNISCEVSGGTEVAFGGRSSEFMERQANQLAPRIQMPAGPFKERAQELIVQFLHDTGLPHSIDVMEMVIDRLAFEFGVSRQAAKIRMVDLGFEEAIGTFTYIDGHYVKPYAFAKGACKVNQTFAISAKDAAVQRFLSPELNARIASEDYLFVDNHFVYNAPLYLQKNADGKLELTEYARSHADECCLLFDMSISGTMDISYQTICYLNRTIRPDIKIDIHYHERDILPQAAQIAYRKKERAEEMEIRMQMTDDPRQCMELLLKWREMKQTDLAAEIEVSPRTISRIINGDTKPDKHTAVKICLGLRLCPSISSKLLEVLDCNLLPNKEEDQCLNEALMYKYYDIEEAKDFLHDFGCEL